MTKNAAVFVTLILDWYSSDIVDSLPEADFFYRHIYIPSILWIDAIEK